MLRPTPVLVSFAVLLCVAAENSREALDKFPSPEIKYQAAKCMAASTTRQAAENCLTELIKNRLTISSSDVNVNPQKISNPVFGPASSPSIAGPPQGTGTKIIEILEDTEKKAKEALEKAKTKIEETGTKIADWFRSLFQG